MTRNSTRRKYERIGHKYDDWYWLKERNKEEKNFEEHEIRLGE